MEQQGAVGRAALIMLTLAVSQCCCAGDHRNGQPAGTAVAPPPYSLDRARSMLTLTRTAYCKDLSKVHTWSCKLCDEYPRPLTNVSAISNASLGMQLFVGVDTADGANGSVLVSFRGSEVLINYLEDLEVGKSAPWQGGGCEGCRVHAGFLDTWNTVRESTLDAIEGKLAANPGAVLRVTGHSMGASMAEMACVDLQAHRGITCGQVYTFGTPRTGNQAFMDAYMGAVSSADAYRVTHWRDPFPHLPPVALGYAHSVTEVFYNSDFTAQGYAPVPRTTSAPSSLRWQHVWCAASWSTSRI